MKKPSKYDKETRKKTKDLIDKKSPQFDEKMRRKTDYLCFV